MKGLYLFLILVFPCSLVSGRGVNGGMSCAVCTVITGVAMQVAEIHEENLLNATKRICNYLPDKIHNLCIEIVDEFASSLTNVSEKITPDMFCLIYGTCTIDPGQDMCHLFPSIVDHTEINTLLQRYAGFPKIDFCKLPIIQDICQVLNNSYTSLNPVEDYDDDGFSAMSTGRGADWRGKDCADNDPNIYPGRRPVFHDNFLDNNCNGIWGVSKNNSQKSYEQLLCGQSEPRGLLYIGDSIGAHFHMPEVWINPLDFDWPGLNASDVILDEIDWPQFGFVNGFKNITPNLLIKGPTDSIYHRLRRRNRCNHRDYQNLSQNGAASFEAISHANSISRNQSTDYPALVIYAMQGNDVCNNLKDTISYMTPPHIFRRNIMKTLFLLDERLPRKSHVVFIGLVEADFIYDAMAERIHPIGNLHQNVYYKDLYNWFNCMQIGPCTGWLNSNETLRNITSDKARRLTTVLKHIVKKERFENFDLHFITNPINYLVRNEHINISQFLEPADSLHPNQNAQILIADVVWRFLKQLPPEVLGPINPYNSEIDAIFGDQGGH